MSPLSPKSAALRQSLDVARYLATSTAIVSAPNIFRLMVRLASGKAATYAHTGTAIAFIISELPGERAEALFIAMAALVPTAGEHSEIQFDRRDVRASAA